MNAFEAAMRRSSSTIFVPLVYRLAARLEQIDVMEMLADPATAAFVLRNAQRLFKLPAVVNQFQLGIELEGGDSIVERDKSGIPTGFTGAVSLGRSTAESLDAIVDTAARLRVELQDQAGILGVLTGPATLASLADVSPSDIADLYVAMARRYADARLAAVLLVEAPMIQVNPALLQETTKELVNICRFYRLKSILLAPNALSAAGPIDHFCGAEDVLQNDVLLGDLAAGSVKLADRKGLLLTAGEVPETLPPEQLKSWIEVLNHASEGASR